MVAVLSGDLDAFNVLLSQCRLFDSTRRISAIRPSGFRDGSLHGVESYTS
jgi:hypothetical protein